MPVQLPVRPVGKLDHVTQQEPNKYYTHSWPHITEVQGKILQTFGNYFLLKMYCTLTYLEFTLSKKILTLLHVNCNEELR